MARRLEDVDYLAACAEYGFQPCGVHKVSHADEPAVLISPHVVPYIVDILSYKFEGYRQAGDHRGLLAVWDKTLEIERDRFYIMCAYLLRYAIPDIWETINART